MLCLAPLLANQLTLLKPYDLIPYVAGAATVLFSAVAATWPPVRRAAAVDPATVLRCD